MRSALVVVFVVTLAGCDPGWSLSGAVVDSAGAPVVGASLTLTCPGAGTGAGAMSETQLTSATGAFSFGGVSGAGHADKCTLAITKAGFTTATVAAHSTCFRSTKTRNLGQPCVAGEGRITLVP